MAERPKPPEGYENWLDLWEGMDTDEFSEWQSNDPNAPTHWGEVEDYACAELSALRAKAAAYDAAMKLLFYAFAGQMNYYEIEQLIRKESKSGRFKP